LQLSQVGWGVLNENIRSSTIAVAPSTFITGDFPAAFADPSEFRDGHLEGV